MNVGAALREFLLEGFLVAGELGGGGVGDCLVGVSSSVGGCAGGAAARGCGGACLVGVAGDVGTAVGSGYGGDRTDGGGVGGRLVGVSAVTADVGAVVVLVAVPVAAVVVVVVAVPVPASTLVAVRAPVAVVALGVAASVAAVVPAGGFAASVLS